MNEDRKIPTFKCPAIERCSEHVTISDFITYCLMGGYEFCKYYSKYKEKRLPKEWLKDFKRSDESV